MNTYYPIHILVAVPCPPSIRDRFSTQFGSQCHFTFINSSQTIPESLLRHTDVILKEGHLKGVALYVSEIEPLPKASPLWDLPNVFITPHIAGPSFGGNTDVEQAIWNLCFENIERFLAGQALNHIVDLRQGY